MRDGENRPYSELVREAAEDWCDKDAAARMLEECKTAFLEKRKNDLDPDLPDSHRERIVKASDEWRDYLVKMVRTRTAANRAKINLTYIETKGWENRSSEATKRAEMRMT